ncbi:MAG: TfoX/Sxy family protein [Chrysiogenetes bacterium]|nr:TfoX/Sxy family protein [Chrysiogenetes bacterium]
MAYDEKLAERIRNVLAARKGVSEKKMFGGLAFLIGGNMACGIVGDELMVRVGPDAHEKSLAEKHVRPMDFTGRPMKGMVYVAPAGIKAGPSLKKWVLRGTDFAGSLPRKTAKKAPKKGGKTP